MPEIRRFTEQDFDESLALSQYAFQYEVPKEEVASRKERLKRHELWGEFEGNTLLSKVHQIPFEIFIGGKLFKMGGVAGVATWPEHRRNRSVARLLKTSLQSMREKGQTVSMLAPFSIPFYRKFGWELTMTLKKVTIDVKDFRFMKEVGGKIRRVDSLDVVNAVYEVFAMCHNGMLKREEHWWKESVYTGGYQTAVYFDESETPTGYILYKVKDKVMDVQEFIYINAEARIGLWNFICQHDSMVDKAKIVLPESDQLPFLLHNPKIEQELVPYFMSRIVEVAAFFELYGLPGSVEKFAISVRDEIAEWNNGVILVDKNGVRFLAGDHFDGEAPLLETDIQSLSAMFLGGLRPEILFESERIIGEESAVTSLEAWLPRTKPTILDFF